MKNKLRAAAALLALLLLTAISAFAMTVDASKWPVESSGWYSSVEEVSVYLATYGKLPGNYLTKNQAQKLGWDSSRGNLWDVANGKSIGGDRFGNYEGNVPDAAGRRWTECDIDYQGGYRGSKRIVFSNDGLIYYTKSHYSNFEQITVVFPEKNAKATSAPKATKAPETKKVLTTSAAVTYGECYTSWEEVAAYLLAYGELPINYISLADAKELGYSSKKDNMGTVAPEFAIGGSDFANREGLLPAAAGRTWKECDVDMKADGKRGDHRLLYSNDGLVYLTRDRYKSFTEVTKK